jgi:diguanylate cyclase (GGDEF)-like protein
MVKGGKPASIKRMILYAIERHRNRAMLQQLSYNDELTGLLNRRGFISMAQQHLKIAQREAWQMVLLFADLDKLKDINDSFGHPEGDRALRAVANVLKETFRTSDLIARLGGDEFIVLAINAPEAGIQKMVSRLQKNIERFNQQNRYYQISLSYRGSVSIHAIPHSLEEMILQQTRLCTSRSAIGGSGADSIFVGVG